MFSKTADCCSWEGKKKKRRGQFQGGLFEQAVIEDGHGWWNKWFSELFVMATGTFNLQPDGINCTTEWRGCGSGRIGASDSDVWMLFFPFTVSARDSHRGYICLQFARSVVAVVPPSISAQSAQLYQLHPFSLNTQQSHQPPPAPPTVSELHRVICLTSAALGRCPSITKSPCGVCVPKKNKQTLWTRLNFHISSAPLNIIAHVTRLSLLLHCTRVKQLIPAS